MVNLSSIRFVYRHPRLFLAMVGVVGLVNAFSAVIDAVFPGGAARRQTSEERIALEQAKLEPQFIDNCINAGHSTRVCRCFGVKMATLTAEFNLASAQIRDKQPSLVDQSKEQMTRCEALSAGPGTPAPTTPRVLQASFMSQPSGASVTVDGVQRGVTPFVLPLEAGVHEALFTLSGRSAVKRRFELGVDNVSVSAELQSNSFVQVTSAPADATVWVDGIEVSGVTPLTAEVTAGQAHTLMVARPGFLPTTATLSALHTADFTERTVRLRSGGKAQFKACAAQAGSRASVLEKNGSMLEAAAKRAEATWCAAQLSIKR